MLNLDVNRFYSIGHRGTEIGAVENTISAIKYAASLNLDFAEIDIQTSKDGEFFVFHDDQMQNKTNLRGKVADHYSEELEKTFIKTHQGQEITPKLSQVFEVLQEKGFKKINLIIELKTSHNLRDLVNLIQKFEMENRILIDSFNYSWLKRLNVIDKKIPISWLISKELQLLLNWRRKLQSIINDNFIGASFHQSNISKRLIDKFHEEGKVIFAWGIKRKNDYEKLLKYQINGFTAPDPKYLVQLMQQRRDENSN